MMKELLIILVIASLVGCRAGSQSSIPSSSKDQFIETLKSATPISELTPHTLEGKLIYYIGTSVQNPKTVPSSSFDKLNPDMTIRTLVDTLGPGFSRSDWGVAFISWYCEDGRELHVSMQTTSLNQIPKVHKFIKDKTHNKAIDGTSQ